MCGEFIEYLIPKFSSSICEDSQEIFIEYLFGSLTSMMTAMFMYDGEYTAQIINKFPQFKELLVTLGQKYKESDEYSQALL